MLILSLDGANIALLVVIIFISLVLLFIQVSPPRGCATTVLSSSPGTHVVPFSLLSHPLVNGPAPPCTSLSEMLDGWFSTDPPHQPLLHPDEDTVMPFVTYSPARCTLADHRSPPSSTWDTAINGTWPSPPFCADLLSKGITFILLLQPSCQSNGVLPAPLLQPGGDVCPRVLESTPGESQ